MSTKYRYSIENDFPNSAVYIERLHDEINASTITTSFNDINTHADFCDVWFGTTLSGSEEATLSGIVATHSGTAYPILDSPYSSTLELIAGQDFEPNKAVYMSGTDEIKLACADSEASVPCIGFTYKDALKGATTDILTDDSLSGFSGLTPVTEYYLSQTTSGEITTVKPTWGIIVRVGTAKNATELDIHILRISNIFGSEYAYEENVGESSTTSTSWQEKLDVNVSNVPAGDYKIVWSFEWSFSRTTGPGSNFGIHINWGAITLSEVEMTPNQTYGDGAFYQCSGFGKVILGAGSHKIALNFYSGGDASTTYIRRAKVEVWRIG